LSDHFFGVEVNKFDSILVNLVGKTTTTGSLGGFTSREVVEKSLDRVTLGQVVLGANMT
jgi:hypothetical protein